jgi:hypothetical protein
VQIEATEIDGNGNVYILSDFYNQPYIVLLYDASGSLGWTSFLDPSRSSIAHGLVLDKGSNVAVTGQVFTESFLFEYGSYKLNSNGMPVWTNNFPQSPIGSSVATSIATDLVNNFYVTGYSPGTNGTNNIATIKHGQNGNQVWVQEYNGPNSGNDAGNAIAVDNNGNVYVTGYETLPGGGTGIVTIKYSPVFLQHRADGTVLLEAEGAPGESFDIQASTDLLNWLDLGIVLADTNGLMQFDDTNAPSYPARFYYTNPQ